MPEDIEIYLEILRVLDVQSGNDDNSLVPLIKTLGKLETSDDWRTTYNAITLITKILEIRQQDLPPFDTGTPVSHLKKIERDQVNEILRQELFQ